ncbi:hypothetical protein SLEP1_g1841 [Rubroshorea leprosula]|uniref:Uncharacterized protein n=1 Tax=Rubroshorea leprosula TaxID=152421 RepID=A0AAV5HJK9_9ROSI|nr:hypothetical protein SLEP1_g1841 [Rubroshorea leprosula]
MEDREMEEEIVVEEREQVAPPTKVEKSPYNMLKESKVLLLLELALAQNTTATETIPVSVGVVLDMDMWVGKLGVSCINMTLQEFYSYHGNYTTRLVLNIRDSKGDVVGAAAAGAAAAGAASLFSLFLFFLSAFIFSEYIFLLT